MSINHSVNIRYNTDVKGLKSAQTELHKLEKTLRKIQTDPVNLAGNSVQQIQILESRIKSLQKTIQMLESSSNDVTMEMDQFRNAARRAFEEYNNGAVKAELLNDKLEIQHRQRMADLAAEERANQKLAMAEERRHQGLVARTKRALGQSFLEAPLYSASFAAMATIGASVQNFIELDKTLTRIGIVTGRSAESMKQFSHYAGEAGKALGVTAKNFADASLTFLQQGGLAADYASSLAENSIKLANITGANASDTSEYITAIANSFKLLETDGINAGDRIADMLASLDAASGSSADEIAGAFKRSASSFAAAGYSAEEASAMISVVSEVTRQSAEMVGTGFKTMLGNLAEVKVGSSEAEAITNQLQDVAKSFGLSFSIIDEQTGDMKKVPQILEEVGKLYRSTGSQAAKNALIEAVAGKEQRDRFIALITNQERYNELLAVAQNSSGAADQANQRYLESSQAKIDIIKNEWEKLTTTILESDGFKDLLDGTAAVLSKINSNIKDFKDLLAELLAIIGPLMTMKYGGKIVGSVGEFVKKRTAAGVLGGNVADVTDDIASQAVSKSSGFSKRQLAGGFLKSFTGGAGVKGLAKTTLGVMKSNIGFGALGAITSVPEIINAFNSDASGVEKFKQILGAAAPAIGGFFGPIGIGVGMLVKMGLGLSNVDGKLQKLRDTAEKNKATFKEAIISNESHVDELVKAVDTFAVGSPEYIAAANELAKLAPQLAVGTDAFGNAVLDNIDTIKEYTQAVKDQISAEEEAAAKKASKEYKDQADTSKDIINEYSENQKNIARIKKQLKEGGTTKVLNRKGDTGFTAYTDAEIKFREDEIKRLQKDITKADYNEAVSQQRANTIRSLNESAKTLGLTDQEATQLQQGIVSTMGGKKGKKIIKDWGKLSPEDFWNQYKSDFISEGERVLSAKGDIQAKLETLDIGNIEIPNLINQLADAANISAEDFKNKFKGFETIGNAIADQWSKLGDKVAKTQTQDLFKTMITGLNIGKSGLDKALSDAVNTADDKVGAMSKAIEIISSVGKVQAVVDKALEGDMFITSEEFKTIADEIAKNPYINVPGIVSAVKGGMTVGGTDLYSMLSNMELTPNKEAINNAFSQFETTPNVKFDNKGKESTISDRINAKLAKLENKEQDIVGRMQSAETASGRAIPGSSKWNAAQNAIAKAQKDTISNIKAEIAALDTMSAADKKTTEWKTKHNELTKELADSQDKLNKIYEDTALTNYTTKNERANTVLEQLTATLSGLSKSNKNYVETQRAVLEANKAILKTEEDRFNFLRSKGSKRSAAEETEFQNLIVKIRTLRNSIKELSKTNAIDEFNKAVFGTADIDEYQKRYSLMQEYQDLILDTAERKVEVARVNAEIENEIKEATDATYKSNLRLLQSKIANNKASQGQLRILESEFRLLKDLQGTSGKSETKLIRTASGEFKYVKTGTTTDKAAMLEKTSAYEKDVTGQYRDTANKIFQLRQDLLTTTDPTAKQQIQKTIDTLTGDQDSQYQAILKAKAASALIASGKNNLAQQVIAGKVSAQQALGADYQSVLESANVIKSTSIGAESKNIEALNGLTAAIVKLTDSFDDFRKVQLEALKSAPKEVVDKELAKVAAQTAANIKAGNTAAAASSSQWYNQISNATGASTLLTTNGATMTKSSSFITDYLKSAGAIKFDTGGYTGESDGFAMLHSKELVLNKIDTKNILDAVNIVRQLPVFSNGVKDISSIKSNLSGTNQTVTINAEFPAVTSSNEIKVALESLSSKAMQYARRTKSY